MKEESVQQGKAYERVISYIKGEILKGDLKPVSYTHLTLPTTPYV